MDAKKARELSETYVGSKVDGHYVEVMAAIFEKIEEYASQGRQEMYVSLGQILDRVNAHASFEVVREFGRRAKSDLKAKGYKVDSESTETFFVLWGN
jgi:hypothetical protein